MTSREQFEAWCINRLISVTRMTGCDTYQSCRTRDLWSAWQASRAVIEIESPEFVDSRSALNKGFTVDYSNGFGDAMDTYEQAIESAGLKIKR